MKYQRSIASSILPLASVALAACGSSDDEGPQGSEDQDDQKVIEVSDQPGSVEDYVGAKEDAEVETCDASSDGLEVAGTITNPESDAQDYRIFVSAMSAGDTAGLVQVVVANVAGGETAEWETQMDLTQEDLDCVLRVERFSAE